MFRARLTNTNPKVEFIDCTEGKRLDEDQCCGSGSGFRIRIKEFKYFNPKNCF
jgi:hypothetical protein